MTLHDIAPGENVIQMANESPESSIAAIVFDFQLLKSIELETAEQAYYMSLTGEVKFIPVAVNYTKSNTWIDNVLNKLTTLDMNSRCREWLKKLCFVLDRPYDSNKGATIDACQNRKGNSELIKLKEVINDFKRKFQEFGQKSTRRGLKAILKDEHLARFLSQTLPSDTNTRNWRSQPSLGIQTHRTQVRS